MRYTISERQNLQSIREGYKIDAPDLTAAKRIATTRQVFQGTVLVISNDRGNVLAYKNDGKWHNTDDIWDLSHTIHKANWPFVAVDEYETAL